MSWRQDLDAFFRQRELRQQREQESINKWQRVADEFLDSVAMPALEELKPELEKHGRKVEVARAYQRAVMTVEYQNEEELAYMVRVRVTAHGARAYPEMRLRIWTGDRQYTAQGSFRSGAQDYGAADITKDEVINYFVAQYTGHFREL